MAMVVSLLKAYLLFTIIIMVIYAIRHFIFSLNRLFTAQRLYYQDIIDSDLKSVSVLIPMHNEERVGACKIFCVKSKSWYNHFIQNGGLQNGKKETQPCKCSRYRPYF